MFDKGAQQGELARGQIDDDPGRRSKLTAHQIQAPAGEFASGSRRDLALAVLCTTTTSGLLLGELALMAG